MTFHQHLNRQTTQVNHRVKKYLEIFINIQPNDWVKQISLVELIANSQSWRITKCRLLFSVQGKIPSILIAN